MALKPIAFDPSMFSDLNKQVQEQNPGAARFSRSNDEENYPVWRTPAEGKFLFYIPNHFVMDDNDEKKMRMDHVFQHRVQDGTRFGNSYRCVAGLHQDGVFSGECPLCNAASTCFGLYNAQIELAEAQKGIAIKNSDDKMAKDIRQRFLNDRVVDTYNDRYVFPAVVIDLDKKNKVVTTDEGQPSYRVYWVSMSNPQFEKLTAASESTMDGQPMGNLFVFNYDYDCKNGQPNAREAGRYLKIAWSPAERYDFSEENLKAFDKMTEDWDVLKAMEMVKDCAFYSDEALNEMLEPIMGAVHDKMLNVRNYLDSINNPGGAVQAEATRRDVPGAAETKSLEASTEDASDPEQAPDVSDLMKSPSEKGFHL